MTTFIALAAEGGFNPVAPTGGGGLMWTIIIFAVALPLMWKVVMGPVAVALEDRDERASRAITLAEKASADAERARAEVEVKLGEARAEASQLLSDARDRATTREKEIVDAATASAAGMVDTARRTIHAEQEKALAVIREEVVDLTMNAASKVLERNVGSEDDRALVSSMVAKMPQAKG